MQSSDFLKKEKHRIALNESQVTEHAHSALCPILKAIPQLRLNQQPSEY